MQRKKDFRLKISNIAPDLNQTHKRYKDIHADCVNRLVIIELMGAYQGH